MPITERLRTEIQWRVDMGFHTFDEIVQLAFETAGDDDLGLPQGSDVRVLDDLPPAIVERVRSAVAAALAEKREAMKSWPAITDCDRLRTALEALNAQGIVAIENCYLADTPAAVTDAVCVYSEEQIWSAVNGDGFRLIVATFGPEDASPPPPKCPVCGGRGWIAADPTQFPARCNDPSHATPVPVHRSRVQTIALAVATACREAGLTAECEPNPRDNVTFVRLPTLRWQRRAA